MTAPLSVKQAAAALGISPSKVYELARAGKVAHYRFDTTIKFEPTDLDAYKQSCRQPCQSPPTTRANGSINLTASLPGNGSALTAYFQRAGPKSRPKNLTASKPHDSTRLQLVYPSTPR